MIIRELEGESTSVITKMGPGEIESLKAGVANFFRFNGGVAEQCLYVNDNDEPIWEEIESGEAWLTAEEAEAEYYQKKK